MPNRITKLLLKLWARAILLQPHLYIQDWIRLNCFFEDTIKEDMLAIEAARNKFLEETADIRAKYPDLEFDVRCKPMEDSW
jgi:hypothetical protein